MSGSRRIFIGLLLCLLLSAGSLSAGALEELQQILQNYERLTVSLSTKYDSLQTNFEFLQNSMKPMQQSLEILENNYEKQNSLLISQQERLNQAEKILADSGKTIKDLQTGYLSMERKYRIYRTATGITVAVLSGMIVYAILT